MRWFLPFACLLTLSAHASSAADAGTTAGARTVPGQSTTAPVSGVILANFDRSVRPQDDFYRFVNGTWLEKTQIPPDRSNYGTFQVLQDSVQQTLRAIVESAAADPGAAGGDRQLVGDLFASYMNEAAAERAGRAALATEFAAIDAIKDTGALVDYFGRTQRRLVNAPPGMANFGAAAPLVATVDADAKQPGVNVLYVDQFGLGMPDRDYYRENEARYAEIRGKYESYIRDLLTMAGRPDAAASASAVLGLETRLAGAQWSKVELRDPVKAYNPYDLEAAAALTPGFDWPRWLAAAGIPATSKLIIGQPSYFSGLAAALREAPLETWKDYLRARVAGDYAPLMGGKFEQAAFDFHERTLAGVQQMSPRWERGLQQVEFVMGEPLGRLYVTKHFPPDAKAHMHALVSNLLATFDASIDELEWMGRDTRSAAHDKLAKFTVKIGYPDKWQPMPDVTVRRDTLVANVMALREANRARDFAEVGKPVDRSKWRMTPQTVNAYYNPVANEIVFPAAILQPPFFDARADDAVNYGGIGAVIGHEVSHGFDDQGRKFDGDGTLRDWWTADDDAKFQGRSSRLVDQYASFSPLAGTNVNGKLTLGENIGDLSGLTVAYKAYRRSLAGREAPVLDGFTGDQRFFIGWGQIWPRKFREEELRKRLLTDPHSPTEYRVNGVVSNMPQFDASFDVRPGDRLYLAPDRRVAIW
jgi:predicted metalloendopeptidase